MDIIANLAKQIVNAQSFDFQTFQDAKMTLDIHGMHYSFDRLSLCEYSHNLSPDEHASLSKHITQLFEATHTREEQKTRVEYGTLFHLIVLQNLYSNYRITKETRPDFVLCGPRKIGIEITEFTTEQDSVMSRIAKENFGKGLSALEIEANAKRHGAKANEYQYYDLNGSAAIASGMYDTSVKHMKYADIITQKFIKYKQDFPLYDEFVVLCNAQHSMCMSSERDSAAVVAFAKNKVPELTAFTLHILRLDDSGRCVVDSFIL